MEARFSQFTQGVLSSAQRYCWQHRQKLLRTEHLLLGMLDNTSCNAYHLFVSNFLDIKGMRAELMHQISHFPQSTDQKQFQGKYQHVFLSDLAAKVLKNSYLESMRLQSSVVGTEHLIMSYLRTYNNKNVMLWNPLNFNYDKLVKMLHEEPLNTEPVSSEPIQLFETDNSEEGDSQQAKDAAQYHANDTANDKLLDDSIDDSIYQKDEEDEERPKRSTRGKEKHSQQQKKAKTPLLDRFGRDLTALALEGRLDPIVGRQQELQRISQILGRRKKNNPILLGEPGVGKSAIVEGLALAIVQHEVGHTLLNKRIVSLDMGSLVAGTKYRGQFEERIKEVMDELRQHPEVIIFIDEIHTMVGAGGSSGSLDASNMLKPALARGEMQCIGATTLDEYRKQIEKDGALERRFQKVMVEPTSAKETLEILRKLKGKYESYHMAQYEDEALEACVQLSKRYITDRFLPDKAIDAMDEAGARLHANKMSTPKPLITLSQSRQKAIQHKKAAVLAGQYEKAQQYKELEMKLDQEIAALSRSYDKRKRAKRSIITADDIAEVMSIMTGIPLNKIAKKESAQLLDFEAKLKEKVVGQDEAISALAKAIRRNRSGLKDPNKPIGSFIFLGPTGVGKTYITKMLSAQIFGNAQDLIRLDMSEFMEKFSVSRLVGAPPGYVGYEEGGQLTEQVRRKPYSIILLDEIEKAHTDVFNMLLQVLDDGQLTDSYGRMVDFKNTIIIMTSNIGSREVRNFGGGIGFKGGQQAQGNSQQEALIEKALKKAFSPEFLNRVDETIMFSPLDKEDIKKIIDIELQGLYKRVQEMGYKLHISSAAKDFLVEKGWDAEYGARPLKRAIQKHVEDLLAETMLQHKLAKGDSLHIDTDKDSLSAQITHKEVSEEALNKTLLP